MDLDRSKEDGSVAELDPFLERSLYRRNDASSHWKRHNLSYVLVAGLVISVFSNVVQYLYIHRASSLDAICVRHTQENPTPIDVPIHYRSVPYDGTFLANSTSIFRLPPSPSVDEAWEGLGTKTKPLLLSPSQASHAGLSLDHLKTTAGQFPVYFEFNHHLHCLNMIRKAVFFNYPYYSAADAADRHIGADEETVTKHVTHCIDILRQTILCKPDLGVFGQYWVRDETQDMNGAFVDFNTNHKCIDWEAVRKWAHEHQTTEKVVVELQAGDKILDVVP